MTELLPFGEVDLFCEYHSSGLTYIGLGSNISPLGKEAGHYLNEAVNHLQLLKTVQIVSVSRYYSSKALKTSSGKAQSLYVNAVMSISTHQTPDALLRTLKSVEVLCNRRGRQSRWSARTLDLDIIDYKGIVRGWNGRQPGKVAHGALILPHPEAHNRPFVLEPLVEIAQSWRHPVYRDRADILLQRGRQDRLASGGEIIVAK